MSKYFFLIHLNNEQGLRVDYDQCRIFPAIIIEENKIFFNCEKIYCFLEYLFFCNVHSLCVWEFEKKTSSDEAFFFSRAHSGHSKWEMNKIGCLDAAKKLCVIYSSVSVKGKFTAGIATDAVMTDVFIIHREIAAVLGLKPEKRLQFQSVLLTDFCECNVISSIANTVGKIVSQDDVLSSPRTVSYSKHELRSAILEYIPNIFSLVSDCKSGGLPRHIHRAKEYIHENLSLPITVVDIAENSFTSIRNLQLGFRKCYDTTPLRYLRTLRLAKARGDLLSVDLYIPWYAIAKKWGFTDFAAFSRYYQAIYEETPFQTSHRIKGPLCTVQ